MRVLILNGDKIHYVKVLLHSFTHYVNRRGADLYNEVLWVSIGQRAAEIPAIIVGGLKKNSAARPGLGKAVYFLSIHYTLITILLIR